MKKKFTAFILCIMLSVSFCFAGCGNKEVNYDIDGETDNVADTTGSSVLATNLGIPDSYEGKLSTGNSGLTSITIKDDKIVVPDGDSMSYVTCVKCEFNSDYKKRICEAIFDKDDGIYVYDYEHQLDSDLQIQLDYYTGLLSSAASLDNEEWEEIYREQIDEFELLMEDSVTELSAAGDYSTDSYIGYIDGKKFTLNFYEGNDEYGNKWAVFQLNYYPNEDLINYKSYKDAEKVDYYTMYSYDDTVNIVEITPDGEDITSISKGENICSEDMAEETAARLLGDIGIEDVAVSGSGTVEWAYTDAVGNSIYYELDGYAMDFTRQVAGEEALKVWISKEETTTTGTNASTSVRMYQSFNEAYTVEVDSNGVISLYADFVLNETDEEQNVELLSWDEVLKILDDGAGEYFAENKPDYSDVVFNDVRLTYMLIQDSNDDDTYHYIPIWYFASEASDEETDENAELYPETVIIINAMDGTIYNLDDVFKM